MATEGEQEPKYYTASTPASEGSFAEWCIKQAGGMLSPSAAGVCFTRAGWEAIRPHLTVSALVSVKREWAILEDATHKFTAAKRLKMAVEEERDELKAKVIRLGDEVHEAKAKVTKVKKLFRERVKELQDKVSTLGFDLDALSEGLDELGEAAEVAEQDEQDALPNQKTVRA